MDPFKRYAASQADQMNTEHDQIQIDYQITLPSNLKIETTLYQNNFKRNWYKLNDVQVTETISISDIVAEPKLPQEYQALLGNTDTEDDALSVKANNRVYESQGVQSVLKYQFGNNTIHQLEFGLRYHQDEEDRFQWKDLYGMLNGEMVRTTVAAPGSDANRISSARAWAAHTLYKIKKGKFTFTPGLRFESIQLEHQ